MSDTKTGVQMLRESTEKLLALLKDPHPDLSTWREMLAARLDEVADWSPRYCLLKETCQRTAEVLGHEIISRTASEARADRLCVLLELKTASDYRVADSIVGSARCEQVERGEG